MTFSGPARLRRFATRLLYGEEASPELAAARALLVPASWMVGAVARARRAAYERGLMRSARAPVPTIAVGNLSLGGTGKTPFVLWLAQKLSSIGVRPGILTRGYGSALGSAVHRVRGDDPREADEALLLARRLPDAIVVAGRDRRRAAVIAAGAGAQALLLDDAFQHLALARDLEILLIDPRVPPGAGRVLPAGPLREPWSAASRADFFVVVEDGVAVAAAAAPESAARRGPAPAATRANGFGKPLVRAERRPAALRRAGSVSHAPAALAGARVFLLSGIAHPAGFRALVERTGARIAGESRHPDHHRFSDAELAHAAAAAQAAAAEMILTTEKDAARLPAAFLARDDVAVLEITLAITEGEERLLGEVRRVVGGGGDGGA
jgi:tetraacyldisaccharide 4'-kinase